VTLGHPDRRQQMPIAGRVAHSCTGLAGRIASHLILTTPTRKIPAQQLLNIADFGGRSIRRDDPLLKEWTG
jgi:hypothetical protein